MTTPRPVTGPGTGRDQDEWREVFSWEARRATSTDAGEGYFEVVGGYDVLVRLRASRAPVTGALLIASTPDALTQTVEAMLRRLAARWATLDAGARVQALAHAKRTAAHAGWAR